MQSLQTITTALSANSYTARELRLILARYRGKRVPVRTLVYWRSKLGIKPDSQGLYDETDLEILTRLVKWLSRGGTINQLIVKILQEQGYAN